MMEKSVAPVFGRLFENLLAPEIYATVATTFATASGVLTITLTSSRVDNSVDPPERRQVVVGRVSMPVAGAADLATALYSFLSSQGFQFTTQAEKDHMQ